MGANHLIKAQTLQLCLELEEQKLQQETSRMEREKINCNEAASQIEARIKTLEDKLDKALVKLKEAEVSFINEESC